ncbi:MAG: RHS repeat-associated core domain-containing protein [Treponema sp.]|nr:RHS repeat-associated core domain-containing protein [Candidatus Treponema caballi]
MKKILAIAFLTLVNFLLLTAEDRYGKLLDRNSGKPDGTSAVGEATGERYRFIDDADAAFPVPENVTGTRTYVYAGMTPVAVTENGRTLYIGTDVRGSVRTLTDRYGSVVARSDYDAFGTPLTMDALGLCGLGYAGKPFDAVTGLYNYGFRDYSPATARFTSVDPIRWGINWYAYVKNDPLNYVDLFGLREVIADGLTMLPNGKIRDDTSGLKDRAAIVITRSPDDNGNNGKYYQSTMEVTVGDVVLSSVPVQSTADHDKINTTKELSGGTLACGEYVGTLLNKSGKYENAISISGEGAFDDDILIHPNVFTALGKTEPYRTDGKPQSLACQISKLGDFNKTMNTLHAMGFSGGSDGTDNAWQRGDDIKIVIKKGK